MKKLTQILVVTALLTATTAPVAQATCGRLGEDSIARRELELERARQAQRQIATPPQPPVGGQSASETQPDPAPSGTP